VVGWQDGIRDAVLRCVAEFVDKQCVSALAHSGVSIAADILRELLADGKCLRSTYLYIGWRCGAEDHPAAIRAAASLELLHAFALMQDDVMDNSPLRRGRPSAHRALEHWHRERGLPGSPARFGESAAVLLGDLCLVWAEQMLRESGLDQESLAPAWRHYDTMRIELAVGQFADLVNDSGGFPSLTAVLDVARRKSGNYTVRRPLEIGAAMAGCDERMMAALSGYGDAVGEAFQLRDDLLGVFGSPDTTGKPTGDDLAARKATTVVVAAYELASAAQRRELKALMTAEQLGPADVTRWQTLIADVGAAARIEEMIDERLVRAFESLETASMQHDVRTILVALAGACTERVA